MCRWKSILSCQYASRRQKGLWFTFSITQVDHRLHSIAFIKWKHFPRYWPFVHGIHRWPLNSRHKGQWRGALMFSLICGWTSSWANNGDAGDLRRHRTHCDVIVMIYTWNQTANKVLIAWLNQFVSQPFWISRKWVHEDKADVLIRRWTSALRNVLLP